MNKRMIWMLVSLLLIVSSVHAIGLSPAKQEFIYDGNPMHGYLRIINSEDKPMRAMIVVDGPLSDYIEIDKKVLEINPHDSVRIDYKIKTPIDLGPGRVESKIIVLHLPEGEKSTVFAMLAVTQKVVINFPYPEEYIDTKIAISAPNYKQPVVFSISFTNLGSRSSEAYAEIVVRSSTNEELFRAETERVIVGGGETKRVTQSWKALNPGNYNLEVTVRYGNNVKKYSRIFHVSGDEIIIKNLEVEDFRLGGIARMKINIESNTNVPLRNIFGVINISDERGALLATVKTSPIDLEPFSEAVLTGYWDTQDFKQGNYDFLVSINYGIDTAKKIFKAYVGIDSVSFENLPTGQVVREGGSNYIALLAVIVLLLIAINIYWLLYIKKHKS